MKFVYKLDFESTGWLSLASSAEGSVLEMKHAIKFLRKGFKDVDDCPVDNIEIYLPGCDMKTSTPLSSDTKLPTDATTTCPIQVHIPGRGHDLYATNQLVRSRPQKPVKATRKSSQQRGRTRTRKTSPTSKKGSPAKVESATKPSSKGARSKQVVSPSTKESTLPKEKKSMLESSSSMDRSSNSIRSSSSPSSKVLQQSSQQQQGSISPPPTSPMMSISSRNNNDKRVSSRSPSPTYVQQEEKSSPLSMTTVPSTVIEEYCTPQSPYDIPHFHNSNPSLSPPLPVPATINVESNDALNPLQESFASNTLLGPEDDDFDDDFDDVVYIEPETESEPDRQQPTAAPSPRNDAKKKQQKKVKDMEEDDSNENVMLPRPRYEYHYTPTPFDPSNFKCWYRLGPDISYYMFINSGTTIGGLKKAIMETRKGKSRYIEGMDDPLALKVYPSGTNGIVLGADFSDDSDIPRDSSSSQPFIVSK